MANINWTYELRDDAANAGQATWSNMRQKTRRAIVGAHVCGATIESVNKHGDWAPLTHPAFDADSIYRIHGSWNPACLPPRPRVNVQAAVPAATPSPRDRALSQARDTFAEVSRILLSASEALGRAAEALR